MDERTRLAMFKLRQTWPPYFSNPVLHNLDTRTHYIDPAWPITARVPDASSSTPNIHFNPDFIQRVNQSNSFRFKTLKYLLCRIQHIRQSLPINNNNCL